VYRNGDKLVNDIFRQSRIFRLDIEDYQFVSLGKLLVEIIRCFPDSRIQFVGGFAFRRGWASESPNCSGGRRFISGLAFCRGFHNRF
jgi:hypothetical protein